MAAATATAPAPTPADVRLMNHASALLFALALAALLASAAGALARLPLFSIQSVRIEGEVTRNSATTIRANALPKLQGSFFTLDLGDARRAFESVPWVRRAEVRRIWPNRLAVRLEEHRAAALWGEERLVNLQGEVFDANLGDVEDDALPVLEGPPGSAPRMLAMHGRLAPLFQDALGTRIETLALTARGSWSVQLASGARVELGRDAADGNPGEVVERTARFLRTLPQLTAQYQRPLLAADLRHRDGYALRLHGITTVDAPTAKKR